MRSVSRFLALAALGLSVLGPVAASSADDGFLAPPPPKAAWLIDWGAHYAAWKMTILGDDLYCHEPFCRQVLALGAHFLITCQPDSHQTLY